MSNGMLHVGPMELRKCFSSYSCDKLNTLSGFVPKVVGSTIGERVGGPGARTLVHGAGGCHLPGFDPSCLCPKRWAPGGPNTSLLSFTRFCSPYHGPLASGPKAHVRPQEKKSARSCR